METWTNQELISWLTQERGEPIEAGFFCDQLAWSWTNHPRFWDALYTPEYGDPWTIPVMKNGLKGAQTFTATEAARILGATKLAGCAGRES